MDQNKLIKYGILSLFLVLFILYTYPLIGLWGQIKPATYPESYQETNTYLINQTINGHIIYLPWELYLTYNWTTQISSDGRIANPINKVVKPIIETSPGSWGSKTSFSNNISMCLSQKNITCLENNNVEYILKDNCAFYPTQFEWINQTLVHEDSCIKIYLINSQNEIDRSFRPPIKFIIGSIISILTLITMIIYLLIK